ncbi:MAG: hypothetical protein M3O90_09460 [Actinomycetota bacterium]|nr:hypothetical protein [Actinomycetota bacterium]
MSDQPSERPIDPAQRRLAERRLLAMLRRVHRSEPLAPDVRVDALISRVRAEPDDPRPGSHRGAGRLILGDDAMRAVVDQLVASGQMVRQGHRVRMPDHEPLLDPQMRERVERLLVGMRSAGAEPPRVDALAARLGIPPPVIEQLRAAGELVALAPGIDYPRDMHESLMQRLDRIAARGPLDVARVRDELRASRRYAEALLRARPRRSRAKR